MLRWIIWLLVLANAGYFAWSQGYLGAVGLRPHEQREPERLQAQIKPETLRLLNGPRASHAPAATPRPMAEPAAAPPEPPAEARADTRPAGPTAPQRPAEPVTPPAPAPLAASASAPVAPALPAADPGVQANACWQASGFSETQADALRAALALLDLPRGSWQLNESRSGGRWIVYMGRYDNAEQLERKKTELRGLKVVFREVSAPGLSPGLALGTYSSEAAAQQALQDAVRSGVRTARVAQERTESRSFGLRLPDATPAQRGAVAGLGAVLAGKTLQRCG